MTKIDFFCQNNCPETTSANDNQFKIIIIIWKSTGDALFFYLISEKSNNKDLKNLFTFFNLKKNCPDTTSANSLKDHDSYSSC